MKIYKISGGLDLQGWSRSVEAIEVEQKPKTYVTTRGRYGNSRYEKKDFMAILSNYGSRHNYYSFYTYCLEGQQQEALDMIKKHIIDKATIIISESKKIETYLTNL